MRRRTLGLRVFEVLCVFLHDFALHDGLELALGLCAGHEGQILLDFGEDLLCGRSLLIRGLTRLLEIAQHQSQKRIQENYLAEDDQ